MFTGSFDPYSNRFHADDRRDHGLALALLVVVPSFPAALVIAVFAGFSWTAMISTLVAGPLFLPAWVMGRGMTIYTIVFTGRQALGALIWGIIASQVGLTATFVICAALDVSPLCVGCMTFSKPERGSHPGP